MKIKEVIEIIEDFAPLSMQESYDNCGLIVGDSEHEVKAVLLCIDVTDSVIDEAVNKGAGLIISHHPVIFGGLKRLTGSSFTERLVIKALRNNIALYAAHTNIDNVWGGVNSRISEKIGLKNLQILSPSEGRLRKLVVFVPTDHASDVRDAIFSAGAGHIGEYDQCSFNVQGEGSFRGSENTEPFAGEAGSSHLEKELRIETIYPEFLEYRILKEMINAHPYEEVAYDLYSLENKWDRAGRGMTGELNQPMDPYDFLNLLKKVFSVKVIRHTKIPEKGISKVAVCGGSGSSMIELAGKALADVYVSGDFKYHDFFITGNNMMIADIGHFESEQFTVEIFHELLTKKIPNFAVHFSELNTNPIQYF